MGVQNVLCKTRWKRNRRRRSLNDVKTVTTRRFVLLAVTGAAVAVAQDDVQVKRDAERLLTLMDQAKYRDCWRQSSQHYKTQLNAEEWESQMKPVRNNFGALQKRVYKTSKTSKTLAGAPEGEYMVLEYTTSFANKPNVTETLVLSREGGGWKLAGYSVR